MAKIADSLTRIPSEGAAQVLWLALEQTAKASGCPLIGDARAKALALLMAHSDHETRHWSRMHCWNFGNLKAGSRYRGDYCEFVTHEGPEGPGRIRLEPPDPACRFRAYHTARAGAVGFVEYLGLDTDNDGHNTYAVAWTALLHADGTAYVTELERLRYFTDDRARYTRSLDLLARAYLPVAVKAISPTVA